VVLIAGLVANMGLAKPGASAHLSWADADADADAAVCSVNQSIRTSVPGVAAALENSRSKVSASPVYGGRGVSVPSPVTLGNAATASTILAGAKRPPVLGGGMQTAAADRLVIVCRCGVRYIGVGASVIFLQSIFPCGKIVWKRCEFSSTGKV